MHTPHIHYGPITGQPADHRGPRPLHHREGHNQRLGAWGEQAAAHYLQSIGYAILDRNWRCRGGEIDLVAFDPERDAIVAVEVKTRRGLAYGSPEESVSREKRRRLRALVLQWMHETHRRASTLAVDVVGVLVERNGSFSLNHVRDVS